MIKKGVLSKTIPSLLGILILVAGIAAGIYLVRSQQLFGSKTSPQAAPQNVTVTNVTANAFTVSWVTQMATTGFIRYGEDEKLSETVNDSRDKLTGETKTYTSHNVNVENLKPLKKYYFKIGSGGSKNLYDHNGRPFELTTAPLLGTQPQTDIIYGKVVDAKQKPVEGAIVYINLANAAPISALTGKDGMWAKPLHTSRSTDLSSYVSYDVESSILTIKVTAGLENDQNATVILTTKNDTPVPTIVLGQNQDYRQTPPLVDSSKLPVTPKTERETAQQLPAAPESEAPKGTTTRPDFSSVADLEPTPSGKASSTVTITNPSKDGEEINTTKPQIIGTGPAKKVLTIEIESAKKYSGTVVIDDDGSWEFTPPENLASGQHTATATYIDENGEEQKISRQFVVLAAGESQLPAFEASPSASATPTTSATPSATLPPRVSTPSTEGGVPASGSVGPTLVVFFTGLLLIFLGLAFHLRLSSRANNP